MVNPALVFKEIKEILENAKIEQPGYEAGLLIQFVTGQNRLLLSAVTQSQNETLLALAKQRAAHYPLQYLIGSWPFMELTLAVGPGVLIPRAETEQVCLAAIDLLAGKTRPAVLDLCSGTGALALGVQYHCRDAQVQAVELSKQAFSYLQKNCARYAKELPRVPAAVQGDVFTFHAGLAPCQYDLILSNPPYVSNQEYKTLAPELYEEPKMALVAEKDGYAFYEVIVRRYYAALKPGGWFVFEIGFSQGERVLSLMAEEGIINASVMKDYSGLARIALGQKPSQDAKHPSL